MNSQIQQTIALINEALQKGILPEKATSGTFETYLMKDLEGNSCAVFKPSSNNREEIKEYAAYLLDYENFAGVPETLITSFLHPFFGGERRGSCQLFHPGSWLTPETLHHLNAASVRRIAILDIRLLNIDRNLYNFLLEDSGTLVPIDHNLILPRHFGECFFAWSDWKEAKTSFSENEKAYIAAINPGRDCEQLLTMGLNPLSAQLCLFATTALQIAAELGLTPYQISFFFETRRSRVERGKLSWARPAIKQIAKLFEAEKSIDPFIEQLKTLFLKALEEQNES